MCKKLFGDYVGYVKDNPKGYWFKAKIYGWGWTPVRWQGWLVLLVFIGLIILNSFRLKSRLSGGKETPVSFIIETVVLVLILLLICYKKGETPRWQWGIPKKEK